MTSLPQVSCCRYDLEAEHGTHHEPQAPRAELQATLTASLSALDSRTLPHLGGTRQCGSPSVA